MVSRTCKYEHALLHKHIFFAFFRFLKLKSPMKGFLDLTPDGRVQVFTIYLFESGGLDTLIQSAQLVHQVASNL